MDVAELKNEGSPKLVSLERSLKSLGEELGDALAQRAEAQLNAERAEAASAEFSDWVEQALVQIANLTAERERILQEMVQAQNLADRLASEWAEEKSALARERDQLAEEMSALARERDQLVATEQHLAEALAQLDSELATCETERDELGATARRLGKLISVLAEEIIKTEARAEDSAKEALLRDDVLGQFKARIQHLLETELPIGKSFDMILDWTRQPIAELESMLDQAESALALIHQNRNRSKRLSTLALFGGLRNKLFGFRTRRDAPKPVEIRQFGPVSMT